MRLFVAAKLSEKAVRSVRDAQDELRARSIRGNYTPPENLHVTLAFIGEYGDPDRVMELLETVSFRPFDIRLDRLGCFGDVWWAGFRESRELGELARKVRRALADGEIPYDRKRFRPHVTILRKPSNTENGLPPVSVKPAVTRVAAFSLMRSDRGKSGMIYTELGSVPARETPDGGPGEN